MLEDFYVRLAITDWYYFEVTRIYTDTISAKI